MNVWDGFNAALSVILSIVIVVVLVCLGWYLVWKLFLSRFKLVRELLGIAQTSDSSPVHASDSATSDTRGNRLRKVRRD